MFISMHSILGWASFCMNYCINAAWHGDSQPAALLRCNEAQAALIAAFRSSALLGLVSLIFLLTMPHRLSMGFRSGDFAGQSSTVTLLSLNQLLVPLVVWAGGKSCWKMKSSSPQSLSAEGSMKCSKFPGRRWLWTSENTVDQHQQMTWQPKSSQTVETSLWTSSNMDSVHSSSRLWDLNFQIKCKIYFHLKRGLWTTEQQSSSFSPWPRWDASDDVSVSEVAW